VGRALVFTRTKHGANRVAERLEKAGIARGGHPRQQEPERAAARLQGFKDGTKVLVATDIAARGLDVDGVISHVINYDVPTRARELRAPHRAHRAGRRHRHGAVVLRP
jgi:ATP-dependent RNA helicase RhlE